MEKKPIPGVLPSIGRLWTTFYHQPHPPKDGQKRLLKNGQKPPKGQKLKPHPRPHPPHQADAGSENMDSASDVRTPKANFP